MYSNMTGENAGATKIAEAILMGWALQYKNCYQESDGIKSDTTRGLSDYRKRKNIGGQMGTRAKLSRMIKTLARTGTILFLRTSGIVTHKLE